MKEFAEFFIYIGCLLTVLIGSFLLGGIFYIATGFDLFVCDWIVVSVILALFLLLRCGERFSDPQRKHPL